MRRLRRRGARVAPVGNLPHEITLMQFIELSGKVLQRVVSDDEFHPDELAALGVTEESVVRIDREGDIELRRVDRWDVIGGLLGEFEERILGRKRASIGCSPRGRGDTRVPTCSNRSGKTAGFGVPGGAIRNYLELRMPSLDSNGIPIQVKTAYCLSSFARSSSSGATQTTAPPSLQMAMGSPICLCR